MIKLKKEISDFFGSEFWITVTKEHFIIRCDQPGYNHYYLLELPITETPEQNFTNTVLNILKAVGMRNIFTKTYISTSEDFVLRSDYDEVVYVDIYRKNSKLNIEIDNKNILKKVIKLRNDLVEKYSDG